MSGDTGNDFFIFRTLYQQSHRIFPQGRSFINQDSILILYLLPGTVFAEKPGFMFNVFISCGNNIFFREIAADQGKTHGPGNIFHFPVGIMFPVFIQNHHFPVAEINIEILFSLRFNTDIRTCNIVIFIDPSPRPAVIPVAAAPDGTIHDTIQLDTIIPAGRN